MSVVNFTAKFLPTLFRTLGLIYMKSVVIQRILKSNSTSQFTYQNYCTSRVQISFSCQFSENFPLSRLDNTSLPILVLYIAYIIPWSKPPVLWNNWDQCIYTSYLGLDANPGLPILLMWLER